jgi:hypothetical protein
VGLILIVLVVWLVWFFGIGTKKVEKREYVPESVVINSDATLAMESLNEPRLKADKDLIRAMLDDASTESAVKNVKVVFVNKMADKDSEVTSFWGKSVWGKSGLACGKPVVSDNGSEVFVNFYVTPDFIEEEIGKNESLKQINERFRFCLIFALEGKSEPDSESPGKILPIMDKYKDFIMLSY